MIGERGGGGGEMYYYTGTCTCTCSNRVLYRGGTPGYPP